MEQKRELVFVGLFVIAATVLLIFTVFSLSGAFAGPSKVFHAKFHNAAGLESGATVRYAGGPKIGRVEKVVIDPTDPTWMIMDFSVKDNIPVKTDSHVAILSFSPLGDNHLEIKAGTLSAPLAHSGATLPAEQYVGFNELTAQINDLAPQAKQLLANLNDRVTQLKVTVDRVNDLLNDENRAHISHTLSELNGMITEDRPKVKQTLDNVSVASGKISPLVDKLMKTTDQAQQTLKRVDDILGENREDIHASVIKLRQSLDNINQLVGRLDRTLDDNTENIDLIIENLRQTTQNLSEFTDSLRTRPSSLLHSSTPKDRKPGDKP